MTYYLVPLTVKSVRPNRFEGVFVPRDLSKRKMRSKNIYSREYIIVNRLDITRIYFPNGLRFEIFEVSPIQ